MTMQFAIVFVNEGNGYQITPKAGDVAYRNHGDIIIDEHGNRFAVQFVQQWTELVEDVLWQKTHVTCKGI